jgi:hypothetical protein
MEARCRAPRTARRRLKNVIVLEKIPAGATPKSLISFWALPQNGFRLAPAPNLRSRSTLYLSLAALCKRIYAAIANAHPDLINLLFNLM